VARLVPLTSTSGVPAQVLEIKLFPLEVGRAQFNLDSASFVSRRHAAIKYDEAKGVYKIMRLSTTNELFLNGKNVREDAWIELPDRSVIGLGPQFMVRFEILIKGDSTWA
jgi:pSer/pThr/pTyr-binding forkhead associated (FHA) protein